MSQTTQCQKLKCINIHYYQHFLLNLPQNPLNQHNFRIEPAIGTQGENTVESNSKKEYSKRSYYNEYASLVMRWANSAGTKEGDTKIFCKKSGDYRLLEADGNGGTVEIARGNYRKVTELYDEIEEEINRIRKNIRSNSGKNGIEYGRDSGNTVIYEDGFDDGRNNSQTAGAELQSDSTGNNEHNRTGDKGESVKYSRRDYSYDSLISKPDMTVTTLGDFVPSDRKDVVKEAKKNATSVGKANSDGSVSVYVDDIDGNVVISTKSIRHSLDRRTNVNGPVILKIGEILKNSIKINELNPREENISQSYILMGIAKNTNNEPYVVSFVVNSYTNTIDTVDVLYSANAKTEPAGSLSPRVSTPSTDSKISIRSLLNYVNKYFPDIIPEEVLKHYGHSRRPDGKLGENVLFSLRGEQVSSNTLAKRSLYAGM